MNTITIRKSRLSDIDDIMRLYRQAKQYMKETGNLLQWNEHYPDTEMIRQDIVSGCSYAGEDAHGFLHFVFMFRIGDEPTYHVIRDGAWLNDEPYGVIHRIASDRSVHGVFSLCLAFCRQRIRNIRIDTHADNHVMRHLLQKNGFQECGTIHVRDGTSRIAYQLPE